MNTWEANIRKVVPYTPGEQPNQPDMIKLNTNENPYPPAPGVEKALHGIQPDTLRLYPDPTAGDLVHAIARNYGLKDEQVFVGVGSDDVLAMSFLTFFNSDKPILFPDITYSFYDVWADLFRIPYECKALDENFCIRKEDYFGENGGIIFPNPNAPTGVELPLGDIEEILLHNRDVIVIVDEAYVDFGAKSALELIEKYDNLLVVQTFSKSRSMAGMRIGFACGHPQLISFLNDVKYSLIPTLWIVPLLQPVWQLSRIRHILQKPVRRLLLPENGRRKNWLPLVSHSRILRPTLSLLLTKAVRPKKFLRPFVRSIFM